MRCLKQDGVESNAGMPKELQNTMTKVTICFILVFSIMSAYSCQELHI